MSELVAGYRRPGLFPRGFRQRLRTRLREAAGLGLLLIDLALALALLTADPADPSFDTATGAPVRNLMGAAGAFFADLSFQLLGLATLLPVLLLGVWGWRLARHGVVDRPWLRLALLVPAVLATALLLAALPSWPGWPYGVGMGGFLGALMDSRLGGAADAFAGIPAVILVYLLAAVLALGLTFFLVGLPWSAYQAAGQMIAVRAAWLGALLERWRPIRAADPAAARWQRLREAERLADERVRHDTGPLENIGAIDRPSPAREARRIAKAAPVKTKPGKRAAALVQPTLDLVPDEDYTLPPLELLNQPPPNPAAHKVAEELLEKNARLLESVLADFGVKGEIVKIRPGPVVTLYELEPAPGTKTSRVVGLADDVARSMSALSVRVAVVPGRSVIGIELPNRNRETVYLRELLASEAYERTAAKLALILGKDIGGAPSIVDLARMPHLLVAGTTGSGKSVAINTMILSLIYRLPPDRCKFIMIDPKMLELSVYDGIPHLLAPVVTEPKKAIVALKWVVREMEQRYRAMSKLGVRNVEGYNLRLAQAREKGEVLTRRVQTGFDPETGGPIYEEEPFSLDPLPFIVVIVDEMADLMMVAGKEIEGAIQRLAQMARAAGIHLIMATQRPSVDVITGTIKANFPTRVSFHVTSKIDSRTILSETGAEQLLGQGDMLYMANGGRITRVHGPFVGDGEVEAVVRFLKEQGEPTYIEEVTREDEEGEPEFGGEDSGGSDGLYDQAVALVCRERKASTSFVQRHLQIGYNRAARIIERMEKEGVVSTANHVGKREVLGRNIDGMD